MDRRNADAAIRKNPFAKNKTFPADIATMLRNADTRSPPAPTPTTPPP
jgi:hypothetical protein